MVKPHDLRASLAKLRTLNTGTDNEKSVKNFKMHNVSSDLQHSKPVRNKTAYASQKIGTTGEKEGELQVNGTTRVNGSENQDTFIVSEGVIRFEEETETESKGPVHISNETQSQDSNHGALLVNGGAGVTKQLNVHGIVTVENAANIDATRAAAPTPVTSLKEGAAMRVVGGVQVDQRLRVSSSADTDRTAVFANASGDNTSEGAALIVANGGAQIKKRLKVEGPYDIRTDPLAGGEDGGGAALNVSDGSAEINQKVLVKSTGSVSGYNTGGAFERSNTLTYSTRDPAGAAAAFFNSDYSNFNQALEGLQVVNGARINNRVYLGGRTQNANGTGNHVLGQDITSQGRGAVQVAGGFNVALRAQISSRAVATGDVDANNNPSAVADVPSLFVEGGALIKENLQIRSDDAVTTTNGTGNAADPTSQNPALNVVGGVNVGKNLRVGGGTDGAGINGGVDLYQNDNDTTPNQNPAADIIGGLNVTQRISVGSGKNINPSANAWETKAEEDEAGFSQPSAKIAGGLELTERLYVDSTQNTTSNNRATNNLASIATKGGLSVHLDASIGQPYLEATATAAEVSADGGNLYLNQKGALYRHSSGTKADGTKVDTTKEGGNSVVISIERENAIVTEEGDGTIATAKESVMISHDVGTAPTTANAKAHYENLNTGGSLMSLESRNTDRAAINITRGSLVLNPLPGADQTNGETITGTGLAPIKTFTNSHDLDGTNPQQSVPTEEAVKRYVDYNTQMVLATKSGVDKDILDLDTDTGNPINSTQADVVKIDFSQDMLYFKNGDATAGTTDSAVGNKLTRQAGAAGKFNDVTSESYIKSTFVKDKAGITKSNNDVEGVVDAQVSQIEIHVDDDAAAGVAASQTLEIAGDFTLNRKLPPALDRAENYKNGNATSDANSGAIQIKYGGVDIPQIGGKALSILESNIPFSNPDLLNNNEYTDTNGDTTRTNADTAAPIPVVSAQEKSGAISKLSISSGLSGYGPIQSINAITNGMDIIGGHTTFQKYAPGDTGTLCAMYGSDPNSCMANPGPSLATYTINAVDEHGLPTNITINNGGSGYKVNQVLMLTPPVGVGGFGAVTSVATIPVAQTGRGYKVGVVEIPLVYVNETGTGSGATIIIKSIFPDGIIDNYDLNPGAGYKENDILVPGNPDNNADVGLELAGVPVGDEAIFIVESVSGNVGNISADPTQAELVMGNNLSINIAHLPVFKPLPGDTPAVNDAGAYVKGFTNANPLDLQSSTNPNFKSILKTIMPFILKNHGTKFAVEAAATAVERQNEATNELNLAYRNFNDSNMDKSVTLPAPQLADLQALGVTMQPGIIPESTGSNYILGTTSVTSAAAAGAVAGGTAPAANASGLKIIVTQVDAAANNSLGFPPTIAFPGNNYAVGNVVQVDKAFSQDNADSKALLEVTGVNDFGGVTNINLIMTDLGENYQVSPNFPGPITTLTQLGLKYDALLKKFADDINLRIGNDINDIEALGTAQVAASDNRTTLLDDMNKYGDGFKTFLRTQAGVPADPLPFLPEVFKAINYTSLRNALNQGLTNIKSAVTDATTKMNKQANWLAIWNATKTGAAGGAVNTLAPNGALGANAADNVTLANLDSYVSSLNGAVFNMDDLKGDITLLKSQLGEGYLDQINEINTTINNMNTGNGQAVNNPNIADITYNQVDTAAQLTTKLNDIDTDIDIVTTEATTQKELLTDLPAATNKFTAAVTAINNSGSHNAPSTFDKINDLNAKFEFDAVNTPLGTAAAGTGLIAQVANDKTAMDNANVGAFGTPTKIAPAISFAFAIKFVNDAVDANPAATWATIKADLIVNNIYNNGNVTQEFKDVINAQAGGNTIMQVLTSLEAAKQLEINEYNAAIPAINNIMAKYNFTAAIVGNFMAAGQFDLVHDITINTGGGVIVTSTAAGNPQATYVALSMDEPTLVGAHGTISQVKGEIDKLENLAVTSYKTIADSAVILINQLNILNTDGNIAANDILDSEISTNFAEITAIYNQGIANANDLKAKIDTNAGAAADSLLKQFIAGSATLTNVNNQLATINVFSTWNVVLGLPNALAATPNSLPATFNAAAVAAAGVDVSNASSIMAETDVLKAAVEAAEQEIDQAFADANALLAQLLAAPLANANSITELNTNQTTAEDEIGTLNAGAPATPADSTQRLLEIANTAQDAVYDTMVAYNSTYAARYNYIAQTNALTGSGGGFPFGGATTKAAFTSLVTDTTPPADSTTSQVERVKSFLEHTKTLNSNGVLAAEITQETADRSFDSFKDTLNDAACCIYNTDAYTKLKTGHQNANTLLELQSDMTEAFYNFIDSLVKERSDYQTNVNAAAATGEPVGSETYDSILLNLYKDEITRLTPMIDGIKNISDITIYDAYLAASITSYSGYEAARLAKPTIGQLFMVTDGSVDVGTQTTLAGTIRVWLGEV